MVRPALVLAERPALGPRPTSARSVDFGVDPAHDHDVDERRTPQPAEGTTESHRSIPSRGPSRGPSHGPNWDAAIEFGIDVTLLERNLRLTPTERVLQHQASLRLMLELQAPP